MTKTNLDNIICTRLKNIPTKGGNVMHFMKSSDIHYKKFGEVYFSWINTHSIKAWKMHKKMTLNLVVPLGKVRFIFLNNCKNETYREEILSDKNYFRLTVPPGIWFGFQGLSTTPSLLANFADIEHDPNEAQRAERKAFSFNWNI